MLRFEQTNQPTDRVLSSISCNSFMYGKCCSYPHHSTKKKWNKIKREWLENNNNNNKIWSNSRLNFGFRFVLFYPVDVLGFRFMCNFVANNNRLFSVRILLHHHHHSHRYIATHNAIEHLWKVARGIWGKINKLNENEWQWNGVCIAKVISKNHFTSHLKTTFPFLCSFSISSWNFVLGTTAGICICVHGNHAYV